MTSRRGFFAAFASAVAILKSEALAATPLPITTLPSNLPSRQWIWEPSPGEHYPCIIRLYKYPSPFASEAFVLADGDWRSLRDVLTDIDISTKAEEIDVTQHNSPQSEFMAFAPKETRIQMSLTQEPGTRLQIFSLLGSDLTTSIPEDYGSLPAWDHRINQQIVFDLWVQSIAVG